MKNIHLIILTTLLLFTACTPMPNEPQRQVITQTHPTPRPVIVPEYPITNPLPPTYPVPVKAPEVYSQRPRNANTDRINRDYKLFIQINKNKDTVVSSQEYLDYCIHLTQHRNDKFINHYIEQHDKNGDGKLSRAEADKEKFVEIDKNHDGFLTLAELSLDWRGIDKKRVVPPTPSLEDRRAERIKRIKNEIRFCDTDKDGQISLKEGMNDRCDSMTKEEFSKYDIDNDGYISIEDRLNYKHENIKVGGYSDMPKEMRLVFAIGTCDKDNNSHLDEKEMTSKECGFTKQDFMDNDYDKDNWYTSEDLDYSRYMRTFHKANTNKDKGLDAEEFKVRSKYGAVPY